MSKSAPSDVMMALMAPDGYYSYLKIPKPKPQNAAAPSTGNAAAEFDNDAVKKAYRKLSLKHHPDKPGGDVDTFRLLNRAHKVLTSPKLREQYDILGIDLDEHDEDNDEQDGDGDDKKHTTTTQGIVQEIANMVLTGIVQLGVRTIMMAGVSLILIRWPYTVFPVILFLLYITSTLIRQHRSLVNLEVWPPLCIAVGVWAMYQASGDFWMFWAGETLVMGMFIYNSLVSLPKSLVLVALSLVVASVMSYILRGKLWNYAICIAMELVLAIFAAVAFPVMEMILEAVLNEKLKAVGDKVRAHYGHMKAYYEHSDTRD